MPFNFTAPTPPSGTMADLLLRQGDVRARAALDGGAANARIANIAGGTMGDLLNAPQKLRQQQADLERQRLQDESLKMTVQGKQQQTGDAQALGSLVASSLVPDKDGHYAYNTDTIAAAIKANPRIAPVAAEFMDAAKKANEADTALAELKTATAADKLGGLAWYGLQSGGTADDMITNLTLAVKNGRVPEAGAAPVLQALQAHPDRASSIMKGLVANSPTFQKKLDPKPATTDYERFIGRMETEQGRPLTAAEELKARKDFETVSKPAPKSPLLEGLTGDVRNRVENLLAKQGITPGMATDEQIKAVLPQAGSLAETAAANKDKGVVVRVGAAAAASGPTAGDFGKEGTDFLQSIPAEWRKTVQKIANYDEDPTKVASMRGGNRERIMKWVNQVNPAYDASMFANRNPTRKAFTTGIQGQQINAMNTVLGHLGQLEPAIEALNHGSFTPGNAAYDYFRTMFGDAAVTNFDNLKGAISGELGKVLKGTVTEGEIGRIERAISTAGSPAQLLGAVKTNIPIIGSKLSALNYQYHQAMGADDPFSALSPDSKSVLQKYGFDPSHPDIAGGGGATLTAPPEGRIRIVGPNGKTGTILSTDPIPAGWKKQ